MYDSLTWVVGILGTLITFACIFVVGCAVIFSVFTIKKLPSKWQTFLSTMVSLVILLAIFKQLTAQNLMLFTYKSIFSIDCITEIFDFSLILSVSLIFCEALFSQNDKIKYINSSDLFIEKKNFDIKNNFFIPSKNLKFSCVLRN